MNKIKNFILKKYYSWKFRNIDPNLCCCGEMMDKNYKKFDSICAHGGCRSAKEYAIECRMEGKEVNYG